MTRKLFSQKNKQNKTKQNNFNVFLVELLSSNQWLLYIDRHKKRKAKDNEVKRRVKCVAMKASALRRDGSSFLNRWPARGGSNNRTFEQNDA